MKRCWWCGWQNSIVERICDHAGPLLATLAYLIGTARLHHVPVTFVRVPFNPADPMVSARNKRFTALNATLAMSEGDDATGRSSRS